MEHNLFKPRSLEEGQHAVVGNCNGLTMQQRWEAETPAFATAILSQYQGEEHPLILDYGCGVGRIAKEILKQSPHARIIGTDASADMLQQAVKYVDSDKFSPFLPDQLHGIHEVGIAYCIYVLQHVPAIEIRDILARIHYHLKDDGIFIYCSSDYRMAIRFDGQGFFDDRFLGVNLRDEIGGFFDVQQPLFSQAELDANPILKTMIDGDLKHPAYVYKKRRLLVPYFDIQPRSEQIAEIKQPAEPSQEKLLLLNRLAPGDILVMTNAIRDLHKAYPGRFKTDVRTPCSAIFENNPYITKLDYDENEYQKLNSAFSKLQGINATKEHLGQIGDITVIDMHYPIIHTSGICGWHFSYGHREWLEQILGIKIPQTAITPEIYLNQAEKDWPSPVVAKHGYTGPYWVINAGSKGDYTLKQYPYYQEVVSLLKDKVQFIQIGQTDHNHTPLTGAINMVGQTDIRELFRLIYHAEGLLTCVSLPMHVAAAFRKPCVVVAGAREGTRWELYPNHQFLYVNGCLPCATYDGCWKSKQADCTNKKDDIPVCMTLIRPEDVAWAIERYYAGGILIRDEAGVIL